MSNPLVVVLLSLVLFLYFVLILKHSTQTLIVIEWGEQFIWLFFFLLLICALYGGGFLYIALFFCNNRALSYTKIFLQVKQKRGIKAVEKEFRQLSAEEREKFEIESLVNVDNIKVQRTFIPKDNKLGKDYIVVYHLLLKFR